MMTVYADVCGMSATALTQRVLAAAPVRNVCAQPVAVSQALQNAQLAQQTPQEVGHTEQFYLSRSSDADLVVT